MKETRIDRSYDLDTRSVSEVLTQVRGDFQGYEIRFREHFGLIDAYLELLKKGAKKTTIRYKLGALDCPKTKYLDLFENHFSRPDQKNFAGRVTIKRMIIKPFGALDEQDARNDGFTSRTALYKGLSEIYGPIPQAACVTIYWIELDSNARTETT